MPTLSLFNTIGMAKGIAGGYKAIEIVDDEDTELELNFRYHQSGDKYRASITVEGITRDYYIRPMASEKLPSSSEFASPLTLGGFYKTKGAVVKTFRITGDLPAKSEGSGDSSGQEEEEEE